MTRTRTCLAAALLAASAPLARAQTFLVSDTTNRTIMLVDGTNGTVLNPTFIVDNQSGNYSFSLPIEALQVNGEVWVSDQVADQVIRFDINGNWLATIGAGLDNLRGMAYHNGRVYVLNFGTANGAGGKRIKAFDLSGNLVANHVGSDLFDVTVRGNELLASNTLLHDLQRYSFTGAFLGTFHDSNGVTGIDFPSQVVALPSGEVIAAGQGAPMGLYVYDANGVQTQYFATSAPARGIARMDDGRYLYTTSNGVHTYNPVTNLHSDVAIGFAGYYVNPYRPPGAPESYCTAGVSSNGCAAELSFTGTPSATAASGFTITSLPMEGERSATFFFGASGRQSLPWAPGSSSYFCVRPPVQRIPVIQTGGSNGNCNGVASFDWNTFAAAHPNAVGQPYSFGVMINAQCWYRDPPAPKNTNLSNALEFFLQP